MTKFFKSMLPALLAALGLTLLGGCFDPSPGEIGLRTTVQGQPRSCTVMVFNAKGKQIQEEHADQYGVVYIKGLAPDTYTLKFKGADNVYAAVRTINVKPGGSAHLDVDLEQAEDKAGEAEANSGGGGGGGSGSDTTD